MQGDAVRGAGIVRGRPGRRGVVLALAAALAGFWNVPATADIVITEINYAPVDDARAPRPDLEFVEIFNDGPEPFDLTGYRFIDGISFEFTGAHRRDGRAYLGPRSYLVIARDEQAIRDVYGISNVIGNFTGALDNGGEDLEFGNPQGMRVSRVNYNDRGKWPAAARGTGHTLSLIDPYSDPSEPESWTISAELGGTPGRANFNTEASFQDTLLIDVSERWRYRKGTSAPPPDWTELGFSDSSWASGVTGIGYGDGDDATVLGDMRGSYLTVFCRKTFTIDDPADIDDLVLSFVIDDGFWAYLNGTEVASHNVRGRNFDDTANSAVSDGDLIERDISRFRGLLRRGVNVLAVQVHNVSLDSSDLTFIPKLVSRRVVLPEEIATVPVVVNEGYLLTAGDRFVELHNTGRMDVDLSGFFLTDDFLDLRRYRIPDGAILRAGGFLAFTEAELGFDLSIVVGVRDRIGIALTNSRGRRVVDAFIFAPEVPDRSEARVPDGAPEMAPAADPTPGAPNSVTVVNDVIFNEIMYNPHDSKTTGQKEREEFIELFNRGDRAVDLSGWRVEGVDLEFPPGTTMRPGAYLVVAADPGFVRSQHRLDASAIVDTPWGGVLRNRGERLRLLDADGNVADTVRYHDGGDWPRWADGGGSSLELIDPWSDNDVGLSWDASDDSGRASTVTLTYGGVRHGGGESDFGILLADEGIAIVDDLTLARSTSPSNNLIPNSTFDSNTAGWRIEGTHSRSGRTTDPGERISGGGSLKLIATGGGGDYKVNRCEIDTASQTSTTHTVRYRARWVIGSNRAITIGDYNVGQPYNAGIAGSQAIPIPSALGTPGAPNSVTLRQIDRHGSPNAGPAIDAVSHSPGVPEHQEDVTVQARVSDPDGVRAVSVWYKSETPVGSFIRRSLTDADGDGVYTGTIPGQSNGVRVLFFIEAVDAEDRASRYPRDVAEQTHPPVLRPRSPAADEQLYLIYRHDTRLVSTNKHSLRFVLHQAHETELATRRVLSNQMLDGTLVFGSSDVYYNASIRFAGSPWLRPGGGTWGKSFAIKTPRDRPLHGRTRAVNLDNHGSDGRERLAHYLLRYNAGSTRLPYFDFHALVRFQLNDVVDRTLEAIDKPNRDYMRFWFRDGLDGPLLELDDRFSFNDGGSKTGNADAHARYPPYGSTSGGADPENYRWYFIPRMGANKTRDRFEELIAFCRLLDPRMTGNREFDDRIWDVADVEEILRVWAIELNIDDWDTWVGRRGKNAYLYQASDDGLWRKVPWDLELTFGDVNAFAMPSSPSTTYGNRFDEIERLINRPRLKRMYYGVLAEMVEPSTGHFDPAFLTPYMQRLSSAGVGSTNRGTNGGFIDQRADRIRGWIRSAVSPAVRLRISTNSGNPLTVNNLEVDLSGTAPADVFTLAVSVNGVFLDQTSLDVAFSTASFTSWTIRDLPLGGGENVIDVVGFSSGGRLVDTDSITVTSTVNWGPPRITDISAPLGAAGDELELTGFEFHDGLRVIFGQATEAAARFDEATDPTRIVVTIPDLPPGPTSIIVRNIDGKESNRVVFTIAPPAPRFVRGDANLDTLVDLSDAVKILAHLFRGVAVSCEDALDADDNGGLNVTDALTVLEYIFRNGARPPAPFPLRGVDPTAGDPLGCDEGLPGR